MHIRDAYYALKKVCIQMLHSPLAVWLHGRPWMKDRPFLEWKSAKLLGKKPDLEHPVTFNEKNNWRKLHDRKEIYTSLVDKYRTKEIIAQRVGAQHTFPVLGVWERGEDIDFDSLPEQFVLKVNHAGGVIVCRDKAQFDRKAAIRELNRTLKTDYFIRNREWPYKDVPRRILAEQYMGENLVDYKNYCFNGRLEYTFVWKNQSRADGRKPQAYFCGAYDRNWVKSDIAIGYPTLDVEVPKPEGYDAMCAVAEEMAQDSPFVRVDCYLLKGIPYVGELTFYPWGGFMRFQDEKFDRLLGDLQKLPE